jgi:hypothetical protein
MTRRRWCGLASRLARTSWTWPTTSPGSARCQDRKPAQAGSAGSLCRGIDRARSGGVARAFGQGSSDVTSLSAWLSLGSANPPSRGLVTTLLAPLGRPAPAGGRWFTQLVTAEASDGRRLRFGSWPAPVPKAGLRIGARRLPLRFYVGFDRGYLTLGLRLGGCFVSRSASAPCAKPMHVPQWVHKPA